MSHADLPALLPLLLVAALPVLALLLSAFLRSTSALAALALVGLAASSGSLLIAHRYAPRAVSRLLLIDGFSLYALALLFSGAFLVALLARDYLLSPGKGQRGDRFYVLLLFAVAGMALTVASNHLLAFFLGLETLTVSLYGLLGFTLERRAALEAGLKYLVLGAVASAFLLFGIALLYARGGTLELTGMRAALCSLPAAPGGAAGLDPVTLLGLALVLVGFGFKLAAVPFHMWSPDVYQGAPAPATALLSSGSKAAVLLALLRFVSVSGMGTCGAVLLLLAVLSALTMTIGNLLALGEQSLRRMLAYSSVAQMGYLLLGLVAWGAGGAAAVGFYLASYLASVIAAFGVLAVLSPGRHEMDGLAELRGLGYRRPLLAGLLALALLSLTGIPLTSGFFAKLYLFRAGLEARLGWLVVLAVVNSAASAYYYLRAAAVLWGRPPAGAPLFPAASGAASSTALSLLGAAVLGLGLWPGPLFALVQAVFGP